MRLLFVVLTIFIFISNAKAASDDIILNKELWLQLKTAMSTISMPLSAHQQIQQLLDNVEKEAKKENKDNKK